MWWSLAMVQGNESATKNLNIIKEEMNSVNISKAQELEHFPIILVHILS